MADYRATFLMSEGGRSNRDQHSLVFRVRPNATFTRAGAQTLAVAVALVLSDVLFNRTHFLRALFAPVNNDGTSTGGASTTIPLSNTGRVAFAVDDGPARDQIVLAILKSAPNGRPGVSLLRHALSAKEESVYVLNGGVPARFEALSADSGQDGIALGPALLAAFNTSGFDLLLPPRRSGLLWSSREVDSVEAQDFRIVQVDKRKRSADALRAQAAQRQINTLVRGAWRLYNAAVELGNLALQGATILAIVGEALGIYNALPPLVRVLVALPAMPQLPEGGGA